MYKGYLNGELFWRTDVDDEGYKIIDPSLSLSAGTAGSLVFTLPSENIKYGGFVRLVDYVDIYRDNELLFSGRVFDDTLNYDKTRRITCEGLMALLNDTIFRPTTYQGSLAGLVSRILDSHNLQVPSEKRITVGNILIPSQNVYRAYETYETSMSRLTDLVDSFGGNLLVYKSADGIKLDWLDTYNTIATQTIDFGENLLDITQSQSADDITTVLIPLGVEIEQDDGTRERLTIESVNDGLDYLSNDSAVEEFGIITRIAIWDDVTEPTNLLNKGIDYLDNASRSKVTISLTAVDLADAGYDVSRFTIHQAIRVKSAPHGINEVFEVKDLRLNLLDPTSNTLTLGNKTYGYIASVAKANSKYIDIINRVSANYALNTDLTAVRQQTVANTTNITQNAEQIQLRATKTYVDDEIAGAKSYADTKKSEAQSYADSVLADFESGEFANVIGSLQDQIDGNIASWFYDYQPLTTNVPASNWDTVDEKTNHLGDLFYWSSKGYCYRWQLKSTADPSNPTANDFEWVRISDEDISNAMALAQSAKDTADGKRRVFTAEPEPPYDRGDLWTDGSDLRVCIQSRQTGSYSPNDWTLATNYIDIDDFTIGGRNLILQSLWKDFTPDSYSYWRVNSNGSVTATAGATGTLNAVYTVIERTISDYGKSVIANGTPLTLTAEYKVNSALTYGTTAGAVAGISLDLTHSGGTESLTWFGLREMPTAVTSGWVKHTVTINVAHDITSVGQLKFIFRDVKGSISIRNAKLEIGNKITDWTPAPEDIEASLADLQDNLQSQLDQKIQTWYQSTDPSLTWSASEKENHNGDLWCYTGTTTGNRIQYATYIYDYSTDSWQDYSATAELFDNIDAKTTIYYGSPTGTYTDVELGDYLVDDTDGSSYRWNGNDWVSVSDYATAILNTEITGLGWKVNYQYIATQNNGECCYYGYNRKNQPDEVDGWVYWNGERVPIPYGYWVNPNATMPFNTLLYNVYRYNTDGTQGTFHDVCYIEEDNKWYANSYTPISTNKGGNPTERTEWTWNEDTDIILAMYMIPSTEGVITNAQLFSPPKKYSELQEKGYSALLSSLLFLEDSLERQIDSKIQTWCQSANPADSWIASERPSHNNDLWYYTGTTNLTVGSTTIQPTGTYRYIASNNTWVAYAVSDLLFDTVDRKSSIYYGTTSSIVPSQGYKLENGDYLVDTSDGSTYRWNATSNLWAPISDFADAIDKIQIGGRNLLPDTDAPSLAKVAGKTNRVFASGATISENGQGTEFVARADDTALEDCPANVMNGVKFVCTATGGSHHMLRFYNGDGRLTFENGETYTASMWVKSTVVDAQVGITMTNVGASIDGVSGQRLIQIDTANKWIKYVYTFKYVRPTEQNYIYFGFSYNIVGTVYCCAFKLEKGTKATDWTLAPEDVEANYKADIADVQQSLQNQIDGKIETWRQQVSPSLTWTAAEKASHDGDLWLYTGATTSTYTQNATYRYDAENDAWQIYSATDDLFNAVDRKTTIYYGSPTPATDYPNAVTGDYLVDASNGKTYRWNGSSWVNVTDYEGAIASYKETVDAQFNLTAQDITATVTRLSYVEGNVNLMPPIYYHEYRYGTSRTTNGVTFTVNEDGSVTVTTASGGATGNASYYLTGASKTHPVPCITLDPDKVYALSGCPAGGSTVATDKKYYMRARFFTESETVGTSGGHSIIDIGNGAHTNSAVYKYVVINITIYAGYEAPSGGITFYPMFESGKTNHNYVSSRTGTGAIFNRVVEAESEISQNAEAIALRVTTAQAESLIEQKADSIRLKASTIAWTSTNSSMTESGILTCNGATINGELYNTSTYTGGGSTEHILKSELKSNQHLFYYDSDVCGIITSDHRLLMTYSDTSDYWSGNYSTGRRPLVIYGGNRLEIGTLRKTDFTAKDVTKLTPHISFYTDSDSKDWTYIHGYFYAYGHAHFYNGLSLLGSNIDSNYTEGILQGLYSTSNNKATVNVKATNGLTVNGTKVQLVSTSSKRYKQNIAPLTDKNLDPHKLYLLKAKQFMYTYNAKLQYPDLKGMLLGGFIAEDVAEIYPSAVIHDENGNIESWDERRIIPAMLALIQEQHERLKLLEEKING